MRRLSILFVTLVIACGTQGTAAPHGGATTGAQKPSAAPAMPGARYGVLDVAASARSGPQVSIVTTAGQVAASMPRKSRTVIASGGSGGGAVAPELPYESASDSLVYYLDGDSTLRSLSPSRQSASVATLPGSSRAHVGFSVRPDGRRIAVSVIDYSVTPPKLSLYVSDLDGGNRVDLLSSNTVYVWPVGWHTGQVVLAVGPAFVQQGAENPYTAFAGYHVVDATTGSRVATMCADGAPIGPLTPAGTLCSNASGLTVRGYDGKSRPIPQAVGPNCLALSPDGTRVACGSQPIMLVGADGGTTRTNANGFAQGFIDQQSLVVATAPAGPGMSQLSMVNVATGSMTPSLGAGSLVASLPGSL
jgi:hypothetical protein